MISGMRLDRDFYTRDVLEVAPDLIGKNIVVSRSAGSLSGYIITEVEAYRGAEDLACHASKGRTARTEIMFREGGHLYVYLIYGMYYMLNVVTAREGNPQAALIRGIEKISGPGKVARFLDIDKSFYGEDLTTSNRIWIEESENHPAVKTSPRIGIYYAGEYWKSRPWRYFI